MSRKCLTVNKLGWIQERSLSATNRKHNYEIVGGARKRNIYRKLTTQIIPKSHKYRVRLDPHLFAKYLDKRRKKRLLEKDTGEKVQVSGLAGVTYPSSKGDFRAEILFIAWVFKDFNEVSLLDSAVELCIDALPDIERISFNLVSHVVPNFERRGIERIEGYIGERINEVDYQIYIPRVGVGRALYMGSASINI